MQKKIEKVSKADEKIPANYESQERIILERIREKADTFKDRELSNEEKARIIAYKDAQQKKKLEDKKKEQRKAEQKKENDRKNQQIMIKSQNSQKAEILRQEQIRKAQRSQAQMRNSTEKRNRESVSLKGGKNIRSKVSQSRAKKKQQMKNNFTDQEE